MLQGKKWLLRLFFMLVIWGYIGNLQVKAEIIYTEKYFKYKVEEESIIICGYFGKEKEITIPSTIAGYPVSVIAAGAFIGTTVETLNLPDTIMEIEPNAIPLGTVLVYNSNIQKKEVQVHLGSVVNATTIESIASLEGGGKYYTNDRVTVIAPAKVGYEFMGWYTKEAMGTDYSEKTVLSTALTYEFTAKDVELVAVYRPNGKVTLAITDTEKVTVTANQQVLDFANGVQNGMVITLTYGTTEEEKANFLYWKNASGKIVSTEPAYEFAIVNHTTLTPVIKSAEVGVSALVEYVNEYEQVLLVETWTKDGVNTLTTTTPSKLGYTFRGWALATAPTVVLESAEAVRMAIANATYIRLVPVYTAVELTEEEKYTVTYNTGVGADRTAKVVPGEHYTVTAGTVDGQKFSHWRIGEEIVSYNKSYTFLVTGDVSVIAVFTEENETVEKTSILGITGQYEIKNGEVVEKVAFVASREIADGYTLLEHGMLYAKDSDITNENGFVEGVAGVNKFTATGKGMTGAFTLNIRLGNAASNIKVRAYVIVKHNETGEVSTLYSTISTYTVTE